MNDPSHLVINLIVTVKSGLCFSAASLARVERPRAVSKIPERSDDEEVEGFLALPQCHCDVLEANSRIQSDSATNSRRDQ